MPLTDAKIRNTKPGDKPIKLTDGGGLYLEVRTTGAKLWRYRYRIAGKENSPAGRVRVAHERINLTNLLREALRQRGRQPVRPPVGDHEAPLTEARHMGVVRRGRQAHGFDRRHHGPEAFARHQRRGRLHDGKAVGREVAVEQLIKARGVELAEAEVGGIGEVDDDERDRGPGSPDGGVVPLLRGSLYAIWAYHSVNALPYQPISARVLSIVALKGANYKASPNPSVT